LWDSFEGLFWEGTCFPFSDSFAASGAAGGEAIPFAELCRGSSSISLGNIVPKPRAADFEAGLVGADGAGLAVGAAVGLAGGGGAGLAAAVGVGGGDEAGVAGADGAGVAGADGAGEAVVDILSIVPECSF
jgi:hypothetical protein